MVVGPLARRKRLARVVAWTARALACVLPAVSVAMMSAQDQSQARRDEPVTPGWCKQLPRPEYRTLVRVKSADPWFEVYRIRPGVFAIYEPHQWEEVISYLIVGERGAILSDTGIGVGKIRNVVSGLTALPVTVLNSHTHFDHVGGNADFAAILNADSDFARANASGGANRYGAWDALAPERLCGPLPAGVTRETYRIRPWKATRVVQDGERLDLGGRESRPVEARVGRGLPRVPLPGILSAARGGEEVAPGGWTPAPLRS